MPPEMPPQKPTDPFDDFDFKPMTEGLGFHKKADKLKKDIQLSNLGEERSGRTVPERPPKGLNDGAGANAAMDASLDLSLDDDIPRRASQSISDLIASLPPSLDFLDDKEDADESGLSPAGNPYIARTFEPKTRNGQKHGRDKGRATKQRATGISAAFSPSTSDEILPSVSAAAQSAASLFGDLAGPRPSGTLPQSPAKPSAAAAAQAAGPQITGSVGGGAGSSAAKIYQALPREDFAPPLAPPMPNLGAGSAALGKAAIPAPISGSGQNAASTQLPPAPAPSSSGVAAAASAALPAAALKAPMPYADKIQGDFARAFPHAVAAKKRRIETPASELVAISTNFAAGLLDALVAAGLSSLFLVCVLAITKADLLGLLTNAQTDVATQMHLGLLFAVVLNLYMLTGRSFFGATLGEWAFETQLGDGDDQRQVLYPLRALWRSVASCLTGFVLLPLLSLAVRKDLGKVISGLQLYRRP